MIELIFILLTDLVDEIFLIPQNIIFRQHSYIWD